MDYASLARPAVRKLHPYNAGTTIDQAKRRFNLDRVIKLSSNENPRGSSPKALAAMEHVTDAHLYADDDHLALRERLAKPYGLGVENTVLGHGSNEILLMFFLTFVSPGDEVIMADPTFSLFPADATLVGATPVKVPLRDGVHDLDAMLAAVTNKTKAVIVCDPNNPSGTAVEAEAFNRFATALPANVLLFIDQAYRDYVPAGTGVDGTDYVKSRRATIVTRTMSKLYGLASVRFGYGFGDAGLIDLLQTVRVPFNVSRAATLAAAGALDDDRFRLDTIEMNNEGREFLEAAFARQGLFYYPSAANFIAVRVPVAAEDAYTDLLRRGIVVRSGDKLGMPNFLRITIGTPEQNHELIAAMDAELPAWRERAPVLV